MENCYGLTVQTNPSQIRQYFSVRVLLINAIMKSLYIALSIL